MLNFSKTVCSSLSESQGWARRGCGGTEEGEGWGVPERNSASISKVSISRRSLK
jgi:hypothetical protein